MVLIPAVMERLVGDNEFSCAVPALSEKNSNLLPIQREPPEDFKTVSMSPESYIETWATESPFDKIVQLRGAERAKNKESGTNIKTALPSNKRKAVVEIGIVYNAI